MLRAAALAVFVFAAAAFAQDPVVIFQWRDDEGRFHYTNNYNSVPAPFRKTVVKGTFVPDTRPEPARTRCEDAAPRVLETNYFVKSGALHVEGTLQNGFAQTISYVKVKVSFFDQNDAFIKAETTFLDPLELAPCAKGRFSLVTPHIPNVAVLKTEPSWK
ncbi:DUF3426 domain-containing protein [bacterium]|nr:DUF3426 domain-containing protein [bacterium]